MRLHKSTLAAHIALQEFEIGASKTLLLYQREVEDEKKISPENFFHNYIEERIKMAQAIKSDFISIKSPPNQAEKAVVAYCYGSMLLLFADTEICKKMIDFGIAGGLNNFTALNKMLQEFDRLETLGYKIQRFYALTIIEGICANLLKMEIIGLFDLVADAREGVIKQSRRKNPLSGQTLSDMGIPENLIGGIYKIYTFHKKTWDVTDNDIIRFQKKVSVGKVPAMMFKNLQNNINNKHLKRSEYYRHLVALTSLITKCQPHSEDYFLENSKIKNYNTYLSRWVRRQWTKIS
jgi:hypothetical protein